MIQQNINNRKVLIIYTGGTIGMIKNNKTGTLEAFNFEHLQTHLPELRQFDYDIHAMQMDHPIDSSDMNPSHWAKLVDIVTDNYDQYNGFVILHGTDTMAYTASALSFMLENIGKPVILTGSQLPIGVLRTDGKENLINAIELAAHCDEKGKPFITEVAVCFGQKLFRGNRVTKCNVESFNAFESFNFPPLAEIGININYHDNVMAGRQNEKLFHPHKEMDSAVIAISLFPGISQEVIENVLQTPHLKGIVLRTFGSGNAPRKDWLVNAIKKATQQGKVIVNITQCAAGKVEMDRYETGVQLAAAGVISGKDMTMECAVTKMMFLFAQNLTDKRIRELMATPIAGEMEP